LTASRIIVEKYSDNNDNKSTGNHEKAPKIIRIQFMSIEWE